MRSCVGIFATQLAETGFELAGEMGAVRFIERYCADFGEMSDVFGCQRSGGCGKQQGEVR